ncbi:hypothetical protein XI03_15235 [Bradyrhizobium sp. CCBAU 65884]|nr:hypothetical protein [Bradyrhizobium sp. CCBAU 65884]
MTRTGWTMLISLLITLVITHLSLWMRGLKPSRRVGLWERMTWEMFPRDEQTRVFVQQRLLTTIVVLPLTLLLLTLLSRLWM